MFGALHDLYGTRMQKQSTIFRDAVPSAKRFAILIYWLAHFLSFNFLASLFSIDNSTAVVIVHTGISVLRKHMVFKSIVFPTEDKLIQVVVDFESLCFLPHCAESIDGTFMEINIPTLYGETYFCYKRFFIIVLGTVDARGISVNVNAGRPVSLGDSYCYKNSKLKQMIDSNQWLSQYLTGRSVE